MRAFITPPSVPAGRLCRTLSMPASPDWLALFSGALAELTDIERWEQVTGGITPEAAAEAAAAVLDEYIHTLGACMIGQVVDYITAEPPGGVLPADGSTYQRDDYPALYAVLDAAFIIDADTFFLPDLRGRVLVAAGQGAGLTLRSIGDSGGEEVHTLSYAEMPVHAHTYVPPTINVDIEAPGVPDPVAAGLGIPTNTGDAGGGQAHENMPPFRVVRRGVRYA